MLWGGGFAGCLDPQFPSTTKRPLSLYIYIYLFTDIFINKYTHTYIYVEICMPSSLLVQCLFGRKSYLIRHYQWRAVLLSVRAWWFLASQKPTACISCVLAETLFLRSKLAYDFGRCGVKRPEAKAARASCTSAFLCWPCFLTFYQYICVLWPGSCAMEAFQPRVKMLWCTNTHAYVYIYIWI